MSFGLDCMNECNDNLAKNRIAACCFVCEMTHGYDNQQFEDLVKCMVDNGGMPKYPDDGICYGTDEDGVRSLQAMEQVPMQNVDEHFIIEYRPQSSGFFSE